MNACVAFVLGLGAFALVALTLHFIGPFPKKYRVVRVGQSQWEVQLQTYLGAWREAGNDYWIARFNSREEAEACIRTWTTDWANEPEVRSSGGESPSK